MKNDTPSLLVSVVLLIIAIIIYPVLYYFGGWITGHILKFFMGETIVNGLNYLFSTTKFTPEMLPMTCGTLGVIGSFFKTYNSSSKG